MTKAIAKTDDEKRNIIEIVDNLKVSKGYVSIEQACEDYDISKDTYYKYKKDIKNVKKTLYSADNGDKVFKVVSDNKNVKVDGKRGRPRKGDMKKEQFSINLEHKYIVKLEEEAKEKEIPVRTHAATYIVTALKEKYPDLKDS